MNISAWEKFTRHFIPKAIRVTASGLLKNREPASPTQGIIPPPGRRSRFVPQRNGQAISFPHFIDRGKPGFISVNR
jgi:hypothetical protein